MELPKNILKNVKTNELGPALHKAAEAVVGDRGELRLLLCKEGSPDQNAVKSESALTPSPQDLYVAQDHHWDGQALADEAIRPEEIVFNGHTFLRATPPSRSVEPPTGFVDHSEGLFPEAIDNHLRTQELQYPEDFTCYLPDWIHPDSICEEEKVESQWYRDRYSSAYPRLQSWSGQHYESTENSPTTSNSISSLTERNGAGAVSETSSGFETNSNGDRNIYLGVAYGSDLVQRNGVFDMPPGYASGLLLYQRDDIHLSERQAEYSQCATMLPSLHDPQLESLTWIHEGPGNGLDNIGTMNPLHFSLAANEPTSWPADRSQRRITESLSLLASLPENPPSMSSDRGEPGPERTGHGPHHSLHGQGLATVPFRRKSRRKAALPKISLGSSISTRGSSRNLLPLRSRHRAARERGIQDNQRSAAAKDQFLVTSKLAGMSYREIRERGGYTVAESTLRGRFRSLTKAKEQRVRSPVWLKSDISLLCEAVDEVVGTMGAQQPLRASGRRAGARPRRLKIPWKMVAEYVRHNGGSYPFGYATCRKKFDEVRER